MISNLCAKLKIKENLTKLIFQNIKKVIFVYCCEKTSVLAVGRNENPKIPHSKI